MGTVGAQRDYHFKADILGSYLVIMKPFGKIFPLTVTGEDLVIPFPPFLLAEISFVGQCTASPNDVEKMLEFAAKHGIKPILEEYPMSIEGATTALNKLKEGGVRYRAVLKVEVGVDDFS